VQNISYEETIGDGTNSLFVVNHNLETKDINVIVRESVSPYDVVDVRWEATTANSITIDFEFVPNLNSKRVAVKGPGTKEFYSTVIGDGSNSTIVVNHGLGSRNIVPVIRSVDSPFDVVEVSAQATSLNSITLDFSSAPDTASLLASIFLLDLDNSYIETVGDGTNNEFTITHNLNTRDIGLICRTIASPYDFVSIRWEATTANTAKVIFSSPPTANSRKIGIYKSLGGSKFFNDEIALSMLDDVSITSPSNGQFLSWNGTNWVNSSAPGGAGINKLDDISDVSAATPNIGEVLQWDGTAWVNVASTTVGATNLDGLSDVVVTSAADGQILVFNGTNWVNTVRPSNEPMGHENKADSVISFNEGTRTFSIAPASTSYTVWCAGKRFVKTGTETVQIPDTSGLYYIYFSSSGVLSYRTSVFVWDTDAPTAYIYWNEVDNKAYFFADERHGITLDWATHEYLHRTRGAAIANGFGVANYSIVGDGSSDAHAKFDLAGGTFFDEDLQVDIVHSATPTANTWEQVLEGNAEIPVFYRLNNHWTKDTATEFAFKQGTSRPKYNLNTAGTWSTTDIDNNKFVISWIIATNNLTQPVLAVMGQASYNTIGEAEAASWEGLSLDGFPVVEFRPLHKVVFQGTNSFTNSVNAAIRGIYDLRRVSSNGTSIPSTPVSDHGSLTGLADDDHTQYLTDTRHNALDHSTAMGTVVLDDISDVTAPTPSVGEVLQWNGTAWVPSLVVGPAGADGADGSDGADGAAGPPGPAGENGMPGAAGESGAPGTDGTDGADGADGADGVGYAIGTAIFVSIPSAPSTDWVFETDDIGAFVVGDRVRVQEDDSNYVIGPITDIDTTSGFAVTVDVETVVGNPDFETGFTFHITASLEIVPFTGSASSNNQALAIPTVTVDSYGRVTGIATAYHSYASESVAGVVQVGESLYMDAGQLGIASGAITDSMINSSAGIALSKLATGTAGNIPVYNGSGVLTSTGSPAAATTSTGASGFGYMGLPQNGATTGAYGIVAADAGTHIYSSATRTITIPANATIPMPIGSTIVFIAGSGATVTIAITSDTMYLAGLGTTGSRTLAAFGMATAVKITSTSWIISGNGLT
jgi:hypothetical protein